MSDVAQGTGKWANSIHELVMRNNCATTNAPSAYIASRRFRMRTIIKMITSSLPYLAKEPNASACGATVQKRLSASAKKATSTAIGVLVPFSVFSACGACSVKSRVAKAYISTKNLATLMRAIDSPTEAAAMQMMASRKLIVFFSKIVAGGGLKNSAHYR